MIEQVTCSVIYEFVKQCYRDKKFQKGMKITILMNINQNKLKIETNIDQVMFLFLCCLIT